MKVRPIAARKTNSAELLHVQRNFPKLVKAMLKTVNQPSLKNYTTTQENKSIEQMAKKNKQNKRNSIANNSKFANLVCTICQQTKCVSL